ncbi:hypothetical protein D918_03670 [Trichuris suis]|nr:hypothetical protein D918_03670 [Trichuris suis]
MSFTCLIALADLGVCTYLACRKTHEPVLALCIRAQVTSKKYYKIYALHTIIITSISALLYVATLLAQIMVRRRQGIADITLASMRYRRDMQIFKSILLVFTCNVFTQVLPWICIYWKINTNRYDWIDKYYFKTSDDVLSLSAKLRRRRTIISSVVKVIPKQETCFHRDHLYFAFCMLGKHMSV